jgi:hypothetical protein
MTEQIELGAWDWFVKVVEKCTFITLNVKERREIQESDYDLLKIFFRAYYDGEYPILHSKLDIKEEVSVQNSLFADGMAEENSVVANGTEFESVVTETIKETEDEKEI